MKHLSMHSTLSTLQQKCNGRSRIGGVQYNKMRGRITTNFSLLNGITYHGLSSPLFITGSGQWPRVKKFIGGDCCYSYSLFNIWISHRVILLFFLPSTTIINNPDRSNSSRGVLVQIHAISTLFLDSILLLLLLLLTCTTLVSLLHVTTYVCTQQDDYFLPSSFPCKQQHHWRCIIIKMPSLSLSLTLLRISHSQTHFFCGALAQFTSWRD